MNRTYSLLLILFFSISADLFEDRDSFEQIECEVILRVMPFRQQERLAEDPHTRSSTLVNYSHPYIPLTKGSSNNWAGYAAGLNLAHPIKNSVSAVHGSWNVPNLSPSSHDTYSSMWVGIDGYGSPSVEQIGTAHEWHNGKPRHYAWFEMYPQASFELKGFPVNPGDIISASVIYQGSNVFVLTITNATRKVTTVVPTSYTTSASAQRICAEWVAEAPYMNQILPLSHFGTVAFTQCRAIINNVVGAINNRAWHSDAITMRNAVMQTKASTSGLSADGQSFSVTWQHE